MESTQKYINIYTEANPNPNSMKFASNLMLVPEGKDYDFPNADSAESSPLAQSIFTAFNWVDRVFIMSNFITLTKSSDAEWNELIPEAKAHIRQWLEEEKPIMAASSLTASDIDPNDSELVKKIKGLLDEYVRPAVEGDGGAITFRSFNSGVVTVELRGSCSGCPSSTITLKNGIQNLLTRMVPEVTEVVAEGM